jgi:hypothetical protein
MTITSFHDGPQYAVANILDFDRLRPLKSRRALALPIAAAVDGFEISAIEDALEDLAHYATLAADAARRSDIAELDAWMHQARLAIRRGRAARQAARGDAVVASLAEIARRRGSRGCASRRARAGPRQARPKLVGEALCFVARWISVSLVQRRRLADLPRPRGRSPRLGPRQLEERTRAAATGIATSASARASRPCEAGLCHGAVRRERTAARDGR